MFMILYFSIALDQLKRGMDEIYDTLAERLVPNAAAASDTNFK